MTELGLQRLEKLLDFAEKTPGHEKFYLGEWHCGTAGCLAGELPYCEPASWYFDQLGGIYFPALASGTTGNPSRDLAEWFGLESREVDHLFMPNMQSPKHCGGVRLRDRSRKSTVIRNAREFITRQRAAAQQEENPE